MNYLDDMKIVNLMRCYLSENIYNYAVMLDGGWGSGKTYFVKEVLIPKLKKSYPKRDAINVSLYGLKSTEAITNSIIESIVEHRMGKGKKMLPILNGAVKIFAEFLGDKLNSDTIANTEIKDIFSPFLTYDDYYFIFDDLERCSMPINEVLGYINHFLEQNSAKVLIIANEKEIGIVELPENRLFKYLIATQDTIKWPEKEKNNLIGHKSPSNNKDKPDLDEIKRRSDLLVDEKTFYLQVKEKLIGQTIFYRPTLQNVVPVIFKKCIGDSIENFGFQNNLIDKICLIMESENHYNLRTLQFAIALFSKVNKDFPCNNHDIGSYQEMFSQILESTLKVSIAHRKGGASYEWSEDSEYGTISFKSIWNPYDYFHSGRQPFSEQKVKQQK